MLFRSFFLLTLLTQAGALVAVEIGTEERQCAVAFSRQKLRKSERGVRELLRQYGEVLTWNREAYHDRAVAWEQRKRQRQVDLASLAESYETRRSAWEEETSLSLWIPKGISFDDPNYANDPVATHAVRRWVNSLLSPSKTWAIVLLSDRSAYKHAFMQKALGKTADIGQYALMYLWKKIGGVEGKRHLIEQLETYEPRDSSRGYPQYEFWSDSPVPSAIDEVVGQTWAQAFPGFRRGPWTDAKEDSLTTLTEFAVDELFDDIGLRFRPPDLPRDERAKGWRRPADYDD